MTIDDAGDYVCRHGVAMDVHCCNCHSGFIFEMDHECPPAETCGWLRRRWHARLRKIDRGMMIPMFLGAVSADGTDDHDRRRGAFELFIHAPGQEHWLCPCSEQDRAEAEAIL